MGKHIDNKIELTRIEMTEEHVRGVCVWVDVLSPIVCTPPPFWLLPFVGVDAEIHW